MSAGPPGAPGTAHGPPGGQDQPEDMASSGTGVRAAEVSRRLPHARKVGPASATCDAPRESVRRVARPHPWGGLGVNRGTAARPRPVCGERGGTLGAPCGWPPGLGAGAEAGTQGGPACSLCEGSGCKQRHRNTRDGNRSCRDGSPGAVWVPAHGPGREGGLPAAT